MIVEVFSAEWCSGCKIVKNALTTKGISFTEKDIDKTEIMEEASQLGIRGIPVTRIFKGGQVETIVGATPTAVAAILSLCSE